MEEKPEAQARLYHLRIQLSGISPPTRRLILVAAYCAIAGWRSAVQLAMGWTQDHLNLFTIRGQRFAVPGEDGLCSFAGCYRPRLADAAQSMEFY